MSSLSFPAIGHPRRLLRPSAVPEPGAQARFAALLLAVLLHALALQWIDHRPEVSMPSAPVLAAVLIAPEPLPSAPPPPEIARRAEPQAPPAKAEVRRPAAARPDEPSPAPQPRPESAPAPLAAAVDAPADTGVAAQPAPPSTLPPLDAPPAPATGGSARHDGVATGAAGTGHDKGDDKGNDSGAATGTPSAPPALVAPRFNAAHLQNPQPPYPVMAKRRGESGRVLLRVRVEASRLPSSVEIAKSSGYPQLDESALETVRTRWKFVPARRGDETIAMSVDVPISFTLK